MKKILFVEDNHHFSRVISFMLSRAGFKVTACYSGEEALKALANHEFECVITDYKMSHVSGLNVAEISRRKWPNIPIFLLTAIPPELLDPHCKSIVDEILVKPVNVDEFIFKVRDSLAEVVNAESKFDRDSLSENQPGV
jgi:two-component system, OmpR family, response regulator VicR